ncbi:MAG: acetolactate synthase small subunit [Candidatus Omnitrophica bacterium 4484_70.1]|nr:MAG: acetolactate synthase small subunit [Candidatus Omnitrophica bacterium 4484_70.1]
MRHTIQALVENRFGVLARIASLFSARGYNIDSLAVGETQDPTISCMTIIVNAEDERVLEQIKKQLRKLIDVITVIDLTRREYIDRELALVKVIKKEDRKKILDKISKLDYVKVLEEKEEYYILEICTEHNNLEEILKELKKAGIKELVRTGKIVMGK